MSYGGQMAYPPGVRQQDRIDAESQFLKINKFVLVKLSWLHNRQPEKQAPPPPQQQGPPPTQQKIQFMLDENCQLIQSIIEHHNQGQC